MSMLQRPTPLKSIVIPLCAGALLGCGGGGSASFGKGVFDEPNAWTKDVGSMQKSSNSDAIVGWLEKNGGWGTGELRIDFSLEVLAADASTPKRDFEATGDFFEPDCDKVAFPVPEGGALEGETGYAC